MPYYTPAPGVSSDKSMVPRLAGAAWAKFKVVKRTAANTIRRRKRNIMGISGAQMCIRVMYFSSALIYVTQERGATREPPTNRYSSYIGGASSERKVILI